MNLNMLFFPVKHQFFAIRFGCVSHIPSLDPPTPSIENRKINILLFAVDMVLFSLTRSGLNRQQAPLSN